jgi:fructose-1-phosphate kinase PfkB-like protein
VGADGGIAAVGEGAGLPVAESSDVVLVAAEGLLFRSSAVVMVSLETDGGRAAYLSLNEQNCWFMTCQTISSEDMMGS